VSISTSTVVGIVRSNAGATGNAGNGGNGGNGAGPDGVAGGGGSGAGIPANGALYGGGISLYDSSLGNIIEQLISACGSMGINGVPGSGVQDTYGYSTYDNNCHSGGSNPIPVVTVSDGAPTITLNGPNAISMKAGTSYIEEGATAVDTKDGVLIPTISGIVNPHVPGTYILTYQASDLGSTYYVNGVKTVFQTPSAVTVNRTVIVTAGLGVVGGGGGGYPLVEAPNSQPQNQAVLQSTFVPITDGEDINTTTCSTWIDKNILYGSKFNDSVVVQKLQQFLNRYQNANLMIDGKYGPMSRDQVNKFQAKFFAEILKPLKLFGPTGHVMGATRAKINSLACELK
jgi:hypothetical protein